MQKLSFLDASFLYGETRNVPMNIASVQLLAVPESDQANYFDALQKYIAQRVHGVRFMTRRLMSTPGGLDQPVWVPDTSFDIAHHVVRIALPAPGDKKALEALISRLHEQPFERSRPLWRYYLIEGISLEDEPDATAALYAKYHHACMDGAAGQKLLELFFSLSPETDTPVQEPQQDVYRTGWVSLFVDATLNSMAQPLRTLSRMPTSLMAGGRIASRWLEGAENLGAFGQRAPQTPLNVAVSAYRNWRYGSLPLSEVKRLGKTYDCTVNDVFLSVCAGALRRYLIRHDALPVDPMIAGVPVSLRSVTDASMKNNVTLLLTSLATDISDPVERLRAISDSARKGKSVLEDVDGTTDPDLHVPGLSLMMEAFSAMVARAPAGQPIPGPYNAIVSNVPGPRQPLYLKGARMLSHFPVSIAAQGGAVNLTTQSYLDRLDFSVTACLEAVPDADLLRDDIIAAWLELKSTMPTQMNRPQSEAPSAGGGSLSGDSQARNVPATGNPAAGMEAA